MRKIAMLFPALLALQVGVPPALAWTWPVVGPVLTPFIFNRSDPYASGQHRGVDIGAAVGDPVLAPVAGTVVFAGSLPRHGRTVTIESPDGYSITLLHLGTAETRRGALVAEGDRIGTVGLSGEPEVDGPYLHLGIRLSADPHGYLDPLLLLPPHLELPTEPESSTLPVESVETPAEPEVEASPSSGDGDEAPQAPVADPASPTATTGSKQEGVPTEESSTAPSSTIDDSSPSPAERVETPAEPAEPAEPEEAEEAEAEASPSSDDGDESPQAPVADPASPPAATPSSTIGESSLSSIQGVAEGVGDQAASGSSSPDLGVDVAEGSDPLAEDATSAQEEVGAPSADATTGSPTAVDSPSLDPPQVVEERAEAEVKPDVDGEPQPVSSELTEAGTESGGQEQSSPAVALTQPETVEDFLFGLLGRLAQGRVEEEGTGGLASGLSAEGEIGEASEQPAAAVGIIGYPRAGRLRRAADGQRGVPAAATGRAAGSLGGWTPPASVIRDSAGSPPPSALEHDIEEAASTGERSHGVGRLVEGGGVVLLALLLVSLRLVSQRGHARKANRALPEFGQPPVFPAEDARPLRSGQHDRLLLQQDLQGVLDGESEPLANLDRDHDTAKLVDVPDDSGCCSLTGPRDVRGSCLPSESRWHARSPWLRSRSPSAPRTRSSNTAGRRER